MKTFELTFTAAKNGSQRAFNHLLRWLASDEDKTRDGAALRLARLLYQDALDEEQVEIIQGATWGWTRDKWNSSHETRALREQLDKALDTPEPCDICGGDRDDCGCWWEQVDADEWVAHRDVMRDYDED